jgi:hypothetical protein
MFRMILEEFIYGWLGLLYRWWTMRNTGVSLGDQKDVGRSNLNHMRQLYITYPICETLSHKLSWSHYVELLKIDDPYERSFYEKQSIIERWSI